MKFLSTVLFLLFYLFSTSQIKAPGKFILRSNTVITPGPTTLGNGEFSVYLPQKMRVSIGAFTMADSLVKTIVSDTTMLAGTHLLQWDATDDNGKAMIFHDSLYKIKIRRNNVTYKWQGTFGNNSDSMAGPNKHHGYYGGIKCLAFGSLYGYFCTGYSEGVPSIAKFLISKPRIRLNFTPLDGATGGFKADNNFVATDGTLVYWGAFDANSNNNSFVHATRVSNDTEVNFPSGTTYTITHGSPAKVISHVNAFNARVTGLAVQKIGIYLFVARGTINQLQVLNKTTGALIQTLTYNNVHGISIDGSDNLWIITNTNTITKHSVNVNGTLSGPSADISGTVMPLYTQVSSGGTVVAVNDAGSSQQVKFYNNTSGDFVNTLGTLGGYQNSPIVTNTKFYFSDVNGSGLTQLDKKTYTAFQPDGTFWVGDPGNSRSMHYDLSHNYLDYLIWQGASYSIFIDALNTSRVFSDNFEFELDHSVDTLTGSTGWFLKNNWGENISVNDYVGYPRNHTTLSNGKTYALLRQNYNYRVVELPSSGALRFTSVVLTGLAWVINRDGSLQTYNDANNTGTLKHRALTGFSGDDPIWGSETTLATNRLDNITGNPIAPPTITQIFESTTNKIAWLNASNALGFTGNVYTTGYHLGIQTIGTNNTFNSLTEKSTHRRYSGPFPKPGYFEAGNLTNGYGGGTVNIIDRHVITSFHGEFWKNAQTNIFNHYYDDGLAIGQFGVTGDTVSRRAFRGMAGNALTPIMFKNGSDYHIIHGDESDHSANHKWKISGISTISDTTITITYPTLYTAPTKPYLDLIEGLPFDQTLVNNTLGWTRDPVVDNLTDQYSNYFRVWTSLQSYNKLKDNDITVEATLPTPQTALVQGDLGTNNVANDWKFSGKIMYPGGSNVNGGKNNQFFEILDDSSRAITRIFMTGSYQNPTYLYAGDSLIATASNKQLERIMSYPQNFYIQVVDGFISVKIGNFPIVYPSIINPLANWRKPKKVSFRFVRDSGSGPIQGQLTSIQNPVFYKDQL